MIGSMKNTVDIPRQADLADAPDAASAAGDERTGTVGTDGTDDSVEQLSLLPTTEVALRFRLPAETRSRGLRHIAEIRQTLAARQAAREGAVVHRLPPRRQQAA